MRPAFPLLLAAVLLVLAGCTNTLSKRAIENFRVGLEKQDLEQLRKSSSDQFDNRALRSPEAPRDLQVLKIPTEPKFKIEKVEQIDDNHRRVQVLVGQKKRSWNWFSRNKTNPPQTRVEYTLTLDRKSRQWVVDDVVLNPQAGDNRPPTISEQMDLLLSAREFLQAWQQGDRSEQLACCTQDFAGVLEPLPSKWFEGITQRTIGTGRQRTTKPQARMNGQDAVVVVTHPLGELFLELKQIDGEWLVNDAAVQAKNNDGSAIPSVKKLARTLNQGSAFLAAYSAADREQLSRVSTPQFQERCLAEADLSTIRLPVAELLTQEFEFRHYPERRELLVENFGTSYMLTLKPVDADAAAKAGREPELRVDEVTIFEESGQQVKRMSAMFLSHAVVQLYGEALYTRDLHSLRKLSAADFNSRVWEAPYAALYTAMPFPELESPEVHVISTVFRGDAVEVTVTQGSRALTYVLNSKQNWMVVDDVVLPSTQRPTSLKKNLELLLPMYAFASAYYQQNLSDLLSHSADGLDSIVWRQVDHVPDPGFDLPMMLMLPVQAVQAGQPWSIIRLGTPEQGAEVRLVREGSRFVVHDINCSGPGIAGGRAELLATLRQKLAAGEIPTRVLARRGNVTISQPREVVPVSSEQPIRTAASDLDAAPQDAVLTAGFETTVPVETDASAESGGSADSAGAAEASPGTLAPVQPE